MEDEGCCEITSSLSLWNLVAENDQAPEGKFTVVSFEREIVLDLQESIKFYISSYLLKGR